MKRMRIQHIVFIIIITTIMFASVSLASDSMIGYSDEKNVDRIVDMVDIEAIRQGNLKPSNFILNETSERISLYEDDKYVYYCSSNTNDVNIIRMSMEGMKVIDEEYSRVSKPTISTEEANEIMLAVVKKVFPEYDYETMNISLDNNTGSHIEYYRFEIEEIINDTRVNIANISLAFNGKVTFISGTHNSKDIAKEQKPIKRDEVDSIALSFLQKHRVEIEKGVQLYSRDDSEGEEVFVASNDMVLPDGIGIGQSFTHERLPEYRIKVENIRDIHSREKTKVFYRGKIVWESVFSIDTSWGDFDSMFNPEVTMYIDAETGEVLDTLITDGE